MGATLHTGVILFLLISQQIPMPTLRFYFVCFKTLVFRICQSILSLLTTGQYVFNKQKQHVSLHSESKDLDSMCHLLAALVALDLFETITISFLPVGHTHEVER